MTEPSEATDEAMAELERRVAAQAEVIMALIAALACDNRELLSELKRLFANRHGQRAHVRGYPQTLDYAEAIITTAARVHRVDGEAEPAR